MSNGHLAVVRLRLARGVIERLLRRSRLRGPEFTNVSCTLRPVVADMNFPALDWPEVAGTASCGRFRIVVTRPPRPLRRRSAWWRTHDLTVSAKSGRSRMTAMRQSTQARYVPVGPFTWEDCVA